MADDVTKLKRAVRRVAAIKGFYVHAVVFALAMPALFFVNWIDLGHGANWWVQWPLVLWGAALVAHGVSVFLFASGESDWEERKVRELMERDA